MATETQSPHIFWEEKISIEPDLGDQRQSTYKALPSPPKTPKRVMVKYRFSGVFPLILSLATFVLTLVVVLAGQNAGMFEGQYLVALNTSRAGQDIITFEKASITSEVTPATSSTEPSPLDPLITLSTRNPLNSANPGNPLSGLGEMMVSFSGNLTDAVNDGLGEAINGVVKDVVNQTGVEDLYYVYLQKVCSGRLTGANKGIADGVKRDDCRSWEDASDSISALSRGIRSSIVIDQTQVSIPLLAKFVSSLDSILDNLGALRKAILAFLVIILIGSILSAISILPAMYFPQSRLLIYFNIFWPGLATVFAFVAAMSLSAINVLAGVMNGFSDTVGVQIRQGGMLLLFVWLGFVFVSLVTLYWASVWFVAIRRSSFVRRRRDEDDIGHWGGIGKEIWRDLKGRWRRPTMRAYI